jgi:ArsR family transcriptional regulator, arsenate/arsenite/antimonite-responsive transcriptional repressor
MKQVTTSAQTLATSTRFFKALADPVRLRLLNLLSGGQEVCVCHLQEALQLPQPTVSRHLAYLRRAGLVVGRKDGLWVHYRLADPRNRLQQVLVDSVRLADEEVFTQDTQRLEESNRCCEGA